LKTENLTVFDSRHRVASSHTHRRPAPAGSGLPELPERRRFPITLEVIRGMSVRIAAWFFGKRLKSGGDYARKKQQEKPRFLGAGIDRFRGGAGAWLDGPAGGGGAELGDLVQRSGA
jgi:hypothetical protein